MRQKDLKAARKVLGTALGKCPKPKLFNGYIEIELQLREFDRCRKLYEKYLEFSAANCHTWIKYAELETILGDADRARAIFELAINQPLMDMPEILWKSYIDFELEQEDHENARQLYERLLERTQHVKVWMSYAKFESSLSHEEAVSNARSVYERANKALRASESSEERAMLLESWREFEKEHGTVQSIEAVCKKLPRRVKRKRKVYLEDGSDAGWEEYWDYLFPEDENAATSLKVLQMARMWKRKQALGEESSSSSSEESEEESDHEGEKNGGGFDDQDTDYSESSSSGKED